MGCVGRPGENGKHDDCRSCKVKLHARTHLRDALAAHDKEIELDIIAYGHNHPVVANTSRKSEHARRKKARHSSPEPHRN